MNSRRQFLNRLIAAGVVATLSPKELLWTPGKKMISIPKPAVYSPSGTTACTFEIVWETSTADKYQDFLARMLEQRQPYSSWSKLPAPA